MVDSVISRCAITIANSPRAGSKLALIKGFIGGVNSILSLFPDIF